MTERTIEDEILRQVEGKEEDAYLEPRKFAYRVLTVLGLKLDLDIISSTEQSVQEAVLWVEDIDDDDWANWDQDSSNDFNPNDDRYSYTESAPSPTEMPLSADQEEELLARFPDTDLL
jgi:hypothetical protein